MYLLFTVSYYIQISTNIKIRIIKLIAFLLDWVFGPSGLKNLFYFCGKLSVLRCYVWFFIEPVLIQRISITFRALLEKKILNLLSTLYFQTLSLEAVYNIVGGTGADFGCLGSFGGAGAAGGRSMSHATELNPVKANARASNFLRGLAFSVFAQVNFKN